MDTTSHTLLAQIQAQTPEAWDRLVRLYRPFLYAWFRKQGVPHPEAEDLAQDVLVCIFREMPGFEHAGHPGAFRNWLRRIALHQALGFWRARRVREQAAGGSDFQDMLEHWPDPSGELEQQWDRDHDQHLMQHILQEVAREVEPTTMQAFRRLAIDGEPPIKVAEELGLSVGAVYIAKSRVLRRLRALAQGLMDESHFS